jgi:hypothetical protein
MAALTIVDGPMCEPVSLTTLKNFLRADLTITDEDDVITVLGAAAREYCEKFTGRTFVKKDYIQSLDMFPYYTDRDTGNYSGQRGDALARYALIRNSSQVIKLYNPPTITVDHIIYTDQFNVVQTLLPFVPVTNPTGFFIDAASEPGRILPQVGLYWPYLQYVPNAVQIFYSAGYGNETAIQTALAAYKTANPTFTQTQYDTFEAAQRQAAVPNGLKFAIMSLAAHWYIHRESVSEMTLSEAPQSIKAMLWAYRVLEFAPTQG